MGHALVTVPAVAATCTSTGLTEGEKCGRCGYVSVAQQTVAKLPHTSVYTEAVAPTCTETGLTEGYVCSVCGKIISGRTTVAALGHTEEPIGQRVEPTCSTTGMTEGIRCSVCGAVLEEQTEIETIPHDYDENDICKEAFRKCNSLVSVTIGNGAANIGDYAFAYCKNLSEVSIPNGVTSMGSYIFAYCTGLTTITLPDSLTSLGERAFYECSALTNVKLSNSITSIEQFTFYGCTNLSDVVIPEGVTRIGRYSFSDCMGLTEIVIPRSVTEIADWAFNHCENLAKVIFLGAKPEFGGNYVFNCSYPSITYPGGAGWYDQPSFHGVTWTPVWASSVRLLNAEGENVSGTTARVCLNLDARSLRFRAEVQPLGAYGECTWEWSKDLAAVTENADGSITVTPTGKPGTMTLKAMSKENSKLTASMTIHFLNAEIQKEEIPGQDPADMNLLSGKSKTLTVLNQDTGKPLPAKEITWSMDEVYAPYAKIDKNGKLTAKKVVEKVRVEAVATIIGSEGTTVTMTVDIFPAVSALELLDGEEIVNNKTISMDGSAEPLVLTADIHPLDAMEGVTWTISDKKEAFATYDIDEENGTLTITPKADAKAGAVTIKATSTDGSKKTASVKLQFGSYAKTVTIDKSITTLTAGDKAVQLSATMEPAVVTKSGIVWSLKDANDKNYVNLSSSGKITPKNVLAPVDVTIVATSKDGMARDEHTIRILPKSQAQLVTINPTDATNKKLTWKIASGSEYATLSSSGSFKAKKVTAAKTVGVAVSSQDGGASATFYVTITP